MEIPKTKVTKIEAKVEALENYSKRNAVISGIIYQENENPIEVAIKAGELVDVSLEARDIDIAHRLRSRNDKILPPFVIKLVNRYKKIELITQARKIKPTVERLGGGAAMKIYYNDYLTTENQHILTAAKALGSQIKVWSRNGEVYC